MRIAQIAPFDETVPPKKYGGTELVIYNITEELTKRGHKVFLLASGDSKTSAELLPIFPKGLRVIRKFQNERINEYLKSVGISKVLKYLKALKVDIVHNHIGWRLLSFSSFVKKPIVTTLHGPLDVENQNLIYSNFKEANYVSISNNQREPLPDLNYIATVYNGIDIKKFPFSEKGGEYLAFLGRMSPEKGPVQAIMAAKKNGFQLKMAAKVDAVDKEFFKKNVAPLIDQKQIVFLGEVNHKEKVELLKGARALLAPIQWREPFGLFFIEAMACGVPVIATNQGSVPEIVEDGKTGFIASNEKEIAKALKNIGTIDRAACRKRVEEKFSSQKMADGYEKVYAKILKS